jgi:cell division protein ZapE
VSDASPSATAALPERAAAPEDLQQLYQRELAQRHFDSDPAQVLAVRRLEELRRRLLDGSRSHTALLPRWLVALAGGAPQPALRGLYLWGSVGRGKTWLMDLFCTSLPPPLVRRRHFHRFMYEVHRQLAHTRRRRAPLETIAAGIAREVRVLCFDELQVADIADAMILGGLFAGLLRRGVTLVATSNVPPADLYRDGLQRQRFLPAIALLETHLDVLRLAGDTDYRLRQLTQAGVYLPTNAPDALARLEALFEQLADRDSSRGGAIEIEGRAIAVIRASAAVVWFDFTALCGGPRSQNDYIEIAREYHSVIVSGVPVFDAQHEDEARRFIALVDELYDRNVTLVVSAAAVPAALYRGERLAALFARTASRLTEMQSEEYLSREHRP